MTLVPAPQISPPAVGFTGEKNRLCRMSPMPDWLVAGSTSSWSMIGMIVRLIRFHSLVSEIGMTGCTFNVHLCPSRAGPKCSS